MTILDKYKTSQGKLDSEILTSLSKHQLLGYIYVFEQKSLYEEGLQLCQQQYLWNKALNLYHLKEANTIAQRAGEKNIPLAFLKGVSLLTHVYPDLGTRYLSDIDIYTPKTFKKPFYQLMIENGYTHANVKKWTASEHKDDYSKLSENGSDLHVDVHYRLLYNLNIEIPISNYISLPTLPVELFLFHLITHLGFQHTYLRLNWLFDIYHYYNTYKSIINWPLFRSYFEQSQLHNDLKVIFFILKQHFDTTLPLDVKLSHFDVWFLHKFITEDFLLNPQKNKFNYYAIKHYLNPSLYTAVKYDLLWTLSKLRGAK